MNNNLKKISFALAQLIALTILCLPLHALAANRVSIPKQFQGLWADRQVGCKKNPVDSDTGYAINATSILQHEQSCVIYGITNAGPNFITAKFECREEDMMNKNTFTLRISKNGKSLSVDKRKLVKCS